MIFNMSKVDSAISPFTARVQNLFTAIFCYLFDRKPIVSKRATPFGNYVSMRFRKATVSPLALLLKEGLVAESAAFEVLMKDAHHQKIDDTDLESGGREGRRKEKATRDARFFLWAGKSAC